MPFLELKCTECGHKFEALTATDKAYPACPVCGGATEQNYNGGVWVNKPKKGGCSGNCATCKGCK